jgi:hypothetical protein
MGRRKVQADCKADTRGGRWAGIPVCVVESSAYRGCSVHAKAILVELVARMNGYNNGKIAVSQRQLTGALQCSPRKVVRCLAELMECGLIDVHTEGKWKERMAREYRLTFVSTKAANATNDYLRWKPRQKSGATAQVASTRQSGAAPESTATNSGSVVVTRFPNRSRKSAILKIGPASDEVSLISKPYVGAASWWSADRCLQANRAILSLFEYEERRAAA